MKTDKKFAITSFLILACGLLAIVGLSLSPVSIQASGAGELRGWAWSSSVGWINFNCKDQEVCGTSDYKVALNSDGTLVGHAWSNNIGWIKFGGLSGFPSGPGTTAVNARLSGDQLQGWARALSAPSDGAGGWDGWISMSGNGYGVVRDDNKLTGFSWGDINVGWLKFDPDVFGVIIVPGNDAILYVQSNLSNVPITSTTAGMEGNTNYEKPSSASINNVALTAPAPSHNDRAFERWAGCDSVGGVNSETCTISVALGSTRTVTAVYESAPEPLKVECLANPASGQLNRDIYVGAYAVGGTPGYTFRWYEPGEINSANFKGQETRDNPGNASLARNYDVVGPYLGLVQVTDRSGATTTCPYQVNISEGGDDPGNVNIQVDPGFGTVFIHTQSAGAPARSSVNVNAGSHYAKITNKGTSAVNLQIESILSQRAGASASNPFGSGFVNSSPQDMPKCYLGLSEHGPGVPFPDCFGPGAPSLTLSPNDTAFFRIEVQRPVRPIFDWSPYNIKFVATNGEGGAGEATVQFIYSVSNWVPM